MLTSETIIDISWPIMPDMTTYKNNKPIRFSLEKNFDEHHVRDSAIALNTHTGTHVDAPSHFLANGTSIESIPLKNVVGVCRILDLTHVETKITAADLHAFNIQKNEILLLKTKNSFCHDTAPFNTSFIYLDKTGAEFLATQHIKTVGIDYLGIEREQPDHETHCVLFKQNITIIEGLRLKETMGGKSYFLCCLPLAIKGLEAAPARAILIG